MARPSKKRKPEDPVGVELPTNPEFQQFAGFMRELLAVPKEEIDRRVAEEEASRKGKAT